MFSGDYDGNIIHWRIQKNEKYQFDIIKKYKAHQSSIV